MRKIVLHRHQKNKYLKLEERIKNSLSPQDWYQQEHSAVLCATKKRLWSMIPTKTNPSRNNLFYELFYNTSFQIFSLPFMPPVFILAPLPLAFFKLLCFRLSFFFPIPVYILTIVHYWRILNYHSSVDKLLNLEFRSITFTYVCFKIFTMLSHVNILQVPQSQISKFNLSYPHPIPVSFFVISISVMAPLIIELPGQKLRHVLRSLP